MQVIASDLLNKARMGALQWRVIILCSLVALVDGFDIQTMALVTPHLSAEWGLPASTFGPVLSSSFVGIMFGAMAGGLLGDRFGRKGVLVGAVLAVGLMSGLTAFAGSPIQLVIYRLLTGFGIGCCMPNFTALTAEYAPARRSGLLITLMYSSVPLGGMLGGLIAPDIIANFGWRGVFLAGAVFPIVIAIATAFTLPESLRFLIATGKRHAAIGHYLGKIDRNYIYSADHEFHEDQQPKAHALRALFTGGLATTTILLWTVFFFSLFGLYLLTSWLPTVFRQLGWPMAEAIRSVLFFQLGGILGGLVLGFLLDRMSSYLLIGIAYLAAAGFVAAIGVAGDQVVPVMIVVLLAGFAVNAAQLGMTVVAAQLYPTAARSTGVGWGLGIGRLGAVISPTLGGFALAAHWARPTLFVLAAIPALICAVGMVFLSMAKRRHATLKHS